MKKTNVQALWEPPPLPDAAHARPRRSASAWLWIVPVVGLALVGVGFSAWNLGNRFQHAYNEAAPKGAVFVKGVGSKIEERIQSELLLQGFLQRGAETIAIINDQIVSSNDTLSVELGTRTYHLQVKAITDGRIVLAVQ